MIDAYLVDRSTNHADKVDLPHGLNVFLGQSQRVRAAERPRDRFPRGLQSARRPLGLQSRSRHADQLTFSAIASLRATPLPPSQIVHYKSFDGKIITALLWVPFNLKRDGSNPAIVLPHGGPTGQMVDYWNTDVAALSLARIHLHRSQPARVHGLWPGFPKGQLSGLRRRRPQRRDCRRRLPQSHGLRRFQENRHLRRLLRRLHDADGHR